MNPTLYLSCLVVIIGSLSWTASAQDDQEFQSELERLNNTKFRNVTELMAFYEKHSKRIQLTEAERQEADRASRLYKLLNRRDEGLGPRGRVMWNSAIVVIQYENLITTLTKAIEEAMNKH